MPIDSIDSRTLNSWNVVNYSWLITWDAVEAHGPRAHILPSAWSWDTRDHFMTHYCNLFRHPLLVFNPCLKEGCRCLATAIATVTLASVSQLSCLLKRMKCVQMTPVTECPVRDKTRAISLHVMSEDCFKKTKGALQPD